MTNPRLLEQLNYPMIAVFLDLCQTRNLSLTARRLKKSKSQVSTLLKKLEAITGLALVCRQGQTVYLNEQGLSLGKSLFALVNLTQFASQLSERHLRHGQVPVLSTMRLKIPIRFFGGGMSQALIRSVAICRRLYPDVFIACEFFDSYNYYHYHQTAWALDGAALGEMRINYCLNAREAEQTLSPWVLLSTGSRRPVAIDSLEALKHYQLLIPKMPWEIMQQMAAFLEARGIDFVYHHTDYTQLLAQELPADRVLLVNRLLLTQGLCRGHHLAPFPADLRVGFDIACSGSHPIFADFEAIFRRIVHKPAQYFPRWRAQHTLRQWQYFHQILVAGSVVGAAKQLYLSQPAVSKQLNQMEKMAGVPLLVRHGGQTLRPTPVGKIYADIAKGMAIASDDLLRQVATQRAYQRQDLNLGILPSVDKNSHLLDLVMNKISKWQRQFPELSINIIEERHQHLLSLLHNQEINLAITEANAPSLTQYPISQPEPLGLVIHPDVLPTPMPDSLSWQSVSDYALIVLRHGTGIRDLIDQQCSKLGITLNIAIESDSLNLNQRWVTSGKYATILPRSAMGSSIERGEVAFIPLSPTVERVLKISHLSARRLNAFEQSLLDSLRGG